jgi:cysteine desulfurase/selenocysteine lyase
LTHSSSTQEVSSISPLSPGKEARALFPFFSTGEGGYYLDSAATSQKPQSVIDSLVSTLVSCNANVHRGAYSLSARATELYDQSRTKIARYIGAPTERTIVFVRGTTEAINLVAYSSEHLFTPGDVIMLSLLEHHSNIVPWQLLAKRRGLKVVFCNITDDGRLDVADFKAKVKELKPKLVGITQLANSLGTVTPIAELVAYAQSFGARVLVDGAQGAPHLGINVAELGCDYYAFSGHKMYGPTGIGVLYGKMECLETLEPFMGGGDMISYVSVEGSGWAEIPQRFEAGTPAFPEAIALGAAVDFLSRFDRRALDTHERHLLNEAVAMLQGQEGVDVHGPVTTGGDQRTVVSFSIRGVHPHDLATKSD